MIDIESMKSGTLCLFLFPIDLSGIVSKDSETFHNDFIWYLFVNLFLAGNIFEESMTETCEQMAYAGIATFVLSYFQVSKTWDSSFDLISKYLKIRLYSKSI